MSAPEDKRHVGKAEMPHPREIAKNACFLIKSTTIPDDKQNSRSPIVADPWRMKFWVPHPRRVFVFAPRVGVHSLMSFYLFCSTCILVSS